MGCAGSSAAGGEPTNQIMAANGQIRSGVRVQTLNDEDDNKWYCGVIEAVYTNGKAKVLYDDGDRWTGSAAYIYVLPPEHPGFQQKVAIGADTMMGPPGMMGNVSNAQMVGPPQMMGGGMMGAPPTVMAQPVLAQPVMGQPPMQQMPVCTATVPPGAYEGQMISVAGPNGLPMNVQVPPGMKPGMSFQFQAAV